MAQTTGEDLWKTFHCLGIEVGNLDKNVVEAWYYTDSMELKNFLSFIANYVTDKNILSPMEVERHEELKEKGKFLEGDDYDSAMKEISQQYPGIFDIEENEFEVELLEDERRIALDHEEKLMDLINVKRIESSKLSKLLSKLETEKITSNIEKEEAGKNCLTLACKLDDVNRKIREEVLKYSEKLNEYEVTPVPSFITTVPLYEYTVNDNILRTFRFMEIQIMESSPKLQTTVASCKMFNETIFEHKNTSKFLEDMKYRVFKSTQNRNYREATIAKLQAKLKYLNNFDVLSLINLFGKFSNLKSSIETNTLLKSEEYNMLALDLESKASATSEKYIHQHSLYVTSEEMKILQSKLQHIETINKIFTSIFSYNTMLYLMFDVNHMFISKSDDFFRAVHKYIINDLQQCEHRIEAMKEIINEYEMYEKIPIEKKNTLLRMIIGILSSNSCLEVSLKSAAGMMFQFRRECDWIETKLFIQEPVDFRKAVKEMEYNNKILKNFLTNGPTDEFVCIPSPLCKKLRELEEIFKAGNEGVHSRVAILANTKKEITNKHWLQYKRQLWMYFLVEPKKVVSLIAKIEAEVQKYRNEQLVSEK